MSKVRRRMNCLKGAGRRSTEQGKEGDREPEQEREEDFPAGGYGKVWRRIEMRRR